MTFTTTPPTTPGFYAWRFNLNLKEELVRVFARQDGELLACYDPAIVGTPVKQLGGEWCRLVPAEEVSFLQKRNDKLTAAIRKFVHRCEIGEIRSRKTYAEYCALLDEAVPNK